MIIIFFIAGIATGMGAAGIIMYLVHMQRRSRLEQRADEIVDGAVDKAMEELEDKIEQ